MSSAETEKYYFGYFETHGGVLPQKWVECDGVCLGGKVSPLQSMEITAEEFSAMPLAACEALWPYRPSASLT